MDNLSVPPNIVEMGFSTFPNNSSIVALASGFKFLKLVKPCAETLSILLTKVSLTISLGKAKTTSGAFFEPNGNPLGIFAVLKTSLT